MQTYSKILAQKASTNSSMNLNVHFEKVFSSIEQNQVITVQSFVQKSLGMKQQSIKHKNNNKQPTFNKRIEKLQNVNQKSLLILEKLNIDRNLQINTELQKQVSIFRQIGIDFAQTELHLIEQQIQELKKKNHQMDVRFFGKILTKKNDFYIITSQKFLKPNTKIKVELLQDPNLFVYISSNLLNWHKLDNISAKDMRNHTKKSQILNGHFENKKNDDTNESTAKQLNEYNSLNCLIKKIIYDNSIVPDGLFTYLEEENELQKNEEFALDQERLQDIEYWQYKYPKIQQNGNIHFNQYQNEEIRDQLTEKFINEKSVALRNIEQNQWQLKKLNTKKKQNLITLDEQQINTDIILFKNQQWPDVYIIFDPLEQKMFMMYIGYGMQKVPIKLQQKICVVQNQQKEKKEVKEPYPEEENSDIVETDSDPELEQQNFYQIYNLRIIFKYFCIQIYGYNLKMKNLFILILNLLILLCIYKNENFNKNEIRMTALKKDSNMNNDKQQYKELQNSEFYSDKALLKQIKNMQQVLKLRDTFIEQEGDIKFDNEINLTTQYNNQKSLYDISYLGAQQKNDNLNLGINKPKRNLKDENVQLYNRYKQREIKTNQMDCALSMKNYGIQYLKESQAAILKVQFRSNCFKHTSQIVLVVQNVIKYPPSKAIIKLSVADITLQFKGIKNNGMFDTHNTQYKITPDQLPKTTQQQKRNLQQVEQEQNIDDKQQKKNEKENEKILDRKLIKQSRVEQYEQKHQDRNLMKTSGITYDILKGINGKFYFDQTEIKQIWDGSTVISCGYTKENETFAYYIMTCHI